jgi:hypothetical protein
MIWVRSIRDGFLGGRGKGLAALLLFGSSWLFSTLALKPMNSGLHTALDGAPAAGEFLSGSGADLWFEMAFRQPAFFPAGFALLLPVLLLYALLGLYLTAGIYGQAALPEGCVWRTFFERARRFFLPFTLGLLMNLIFWAVVAGLVMAGVAGLWKGTGEATDPAVHWRVFLAGAALLAVLLNLFRSSLGFFQARWALIGGREGLGRCFLSSLSFTFKRFIPVNAMTWLFTALHLLVLWVAVFALSPGYSSEGRWFATASLLQAGYFLLAFLRVAEARSQVEYSKACLPAQASRAVPAEPAASQGPPAPEAPPEAESGSIAQPADASAPEVDSGGAGT